MSITQLRSYKIFGLAAFDLILSMIGTILLCLLFRHIHFKELPVQNFILAGILLAIPLGIFFHIIGGVNTKLNYTLGLSNSPK
jgi:hypothetical protein